MHPFERALSVQSEDLEFELTAFESTSWADFLLNPRRLRGSDFLMRWSQGVWSEQRILEAINGGSEFFALPYGPSGVAPDNDVRAFELYFERLEAAGLGDIKRPDLLVFPASRRDVIQDLVATLGGLEELPFTQETSPQMQALLKEAILAIECENSLWRALQMPGYGSELKPQKRLGGLLGLAKNAVLPTVIIKEEDRLPLLAWQHNNRVPIHVWHLFFDRAFGLALNEAERLVKEGFILPTEQVFQAPGGATTRKAIYKFYYHYAYQVGEAQEEPELRSACITDKNGHILPYVTFHGGSLALNPDALAVMRTLREMPPT